MTVMKIYRRSIKKSTSMYTLKPIVVILALFLLMTIGNLKGFLVFLVIELCVLSFIVAVYCNSIILCCFNGEFIDCPKSGISLLAC